MTFEDEDAVLCVYVGRISREKRLDVLMDALKNLDHVYLAIVGNSFLAGRSPVLSLFVGDGPNASEYASIHSRESKIYCKPRFLNHEELAEVV